MTACCWPSPMRGGLRISELVGLSWADVIERVHAKHGSAMTAAVQLSVTGKGGRTRQVLLPEAVSAALIELRGDAGANDPLFASHKGGHQLSARTVNYMLKRTAVRAGLNHPSRRLGCGTGRAARARPWRDACRVASHARPLQRGNEERLSARAAQHSSGLKLDEGIFH